MQGALHHRDGSTRTSPVNRASWGEKSSIRGTRTSAATRTSQIPASRGLVRSSGLALAVIRLTASGRPEVSGVMASMWTLWLSSAMPMISAPSSRDSRIRSSIPRARTTPLTAVIFRVCFAALCFILLASRSGKPIRPEGKPCPEAPAPS